jgi:hypothetical protein
MAYRDNLEDVEAEIRTDIAAGHLDRALNRITSLGEQLFADRSVVTAVYGSYTLDTLCTEIGAVAPTGATAPPQSDLVVYLATELAYPGGHTFVIRDLVRAQPDRRHVLLLSGSLGPVDASRADAFFGGAVDVEVAPPASPSETMKWLIARLGEYHPGRAFLLAHPYDAPAVAAFQPGLAGEMVFYHHVDHTFTLGLNVPSVEVAAFRAAGY